MNFNDETAHMTNRVREHTGKKRQNERQLGRTIYTKPIDDYIDNNCSDSSTSSDSESEDDE